MNPYRILVVDDEDFMLALCKRVLTAAGYEVHLAGSLSEARRKIDGLDVVHLLVTDIQLPDGNGAGVARAVRRKFPEARVLVITAYLDLGPAREDFQLLGVDEDDILAKPFEVNGLEAAVKARMPGQGVKK